METKEEYLKKMLEQEKPKCPHCEKEMTIWEVPPVSFSDGLGWCAPYLFICFNDECSLYTQGWDSMEENFGQSASYRCICYRDSDKFECMPVFSPQGAKGMVIDNKHMMEQEMLRENTKKGFSLLADCYVARDSMTVMQMLTDSTQPPKVRLKAAEMMGDLGELEAAEPLKMLSFANDLIQKQVEESIKNIMERYFARFCPFCNEIIKKKAKICKHCSKDVAGQ